MARVVDEIRYHVRQALRSIAWPTAVAVDLGWRDADDFVVPSIAVLGKRPERTPTSGIEREEDVDADTVAIYWRRKIIELPMTLALYAESRTQRAELVELVEELFDPPPPNDGISEPRPAGLELTLDGHHNTFARVRIVNDEEKDREGLSRGYFRHDFDLASRAVSLRRAEYKRATWTNNATVGNDVEV